MSSAKPEDPKDYRWCGYAQTVAGEKRAKEGLGIVVGYFRNEPVTRADVILRSYRVHLYMEGEEKGVAEAALPARGEAVRAARLATRSGGNAEYGGRSGVLNSLGKRAEN